MALVVGAVLQRARCGGDVLWLCDREALDGLSRRAECVGGDGDELGRCYRFHPKWRDGDLRRPLRAAVEAVSEKRQAETGL